MPRTSPFRPFRPSGPSGPLRPFPLALILTLLIAPTLVSQPQAPTQPSTSPFTFAPESEGRRQITVRTQQGEHRWRLRIPERVFCDEAVLVGHDIHRVHAPVQWKQTPAGDWHYTRNNQADTARRTHRYPIEYSLKVEPTQYGAALHLTFKNTGPKTLHNLTGHVCLGHQSQAFRDPNYERTYVLRDQQFFNLNQSHRGTDPIRAHYLVKNQSPIKIFQNPANRFWGPLSPERADNGLILTQSTSKKHLIALWFDPASELFQNSDQPNMCIHSDPTYGDLKPGETVQVTGRLILHNGTLKQFTTRYQPFPKPAR